MAPHSNPELVRMRRADRIVTLNCYCHSQENTCGYRDVAETITVRSQEGKHGSGGTNGLGGQGHVGEDDQQIHKTKDCKHLVENIPHFPGLKFIFRMNEIRKRLPLQKNDNAEGVTNGSSDDSDEGEDARDEELDIGQGICLIFSYSAR